MLGEVIEYYKKGDMRFCISFDLEHYIEMNSDPGRKEIERRNAFENFEVALPFDSFVLYDCQICILEKTAEWTERSFVSCGNILRMRGDVVEYKCSHCKRWTQWWYGTCKNEYCSHCGYKMTNDSNTIKDYERNKHEDRN